MPRSYNLCVIPGDGVGQETVSEALKVLDAVAVALGLTFAYDQKPWGSSYYLETGRMMPETGCSTISSADATLFGAAGSPEVPDEISSRGLILSIRQTLDLYVNLRPVKLRNTHPQRDADYDLLIIRENTQGEYVGIGGRLYRGTHNEIAHSTAIYTWQTVDRIVEFAFRQVRPGGILTSVTKTNAMPHTMGLWDDVTVEVARRHPNVNWQRMHVDTVAYELVRSPQQFDVIVASNMFGDILSDIGAALQGSLGLSASGNINPQTAIGVFEPVHGSAPAIAGQGIANPVGAISSTAMLLDFLGETEAAHIVRNAVQGALTTGYLTPDLGGTACTSEVTAEIVRRIR